MAANGSRARFEEPRQRIGDASEPALRAFALACVEAALEAVPLDDPAVGPAVEALRGQSAPPPAVLAAVEALTDRLEAESLDAEAAHRRGALTEPEMLERFARARAATALLEALGDNPLAAARDVIAEVEMVFSDEPDDFITAVLPALGGGGEPYRPRWPYPVRRDEWYDDLLPALHDLPDDDNLRQVSTASVDVLLRRFGPIRHRRFRRALADLRKGRYRDFEATVALYSFPVPEPPAEYGPDEPHEPMASLRSATASALRDDARSAAVGAILPAYLALGPEHGLLRDELVARGIIVLT